MFKFVLAVIISLSCVSNVQAERWFLFFSAPWCGPCAKIKPQLKRPDMAQYIVKYENYIVDIDLRPDLKTEYKVTSVPTAFIVETYEENGIERTKLLYKWQPNQGLPALKNALREHAPKQENRPLLRVLGIPAKFLKLRS